MKPTFLFLAAVFVLGTLAGAPGARAQAPTVITTAPYTITKPGSYQLGKDLIVPNTSGNIITIAASNVSLDFNGHYISGPGNDASTSLLTGVYAENRGNLTVRNGTVAFCNYGIVFLGKDSASSANINQRVEHMLVSYCYQDGISFVFARNVEARDCRVSFIRGASTSYTIGIDCTLAASARITDNVVDNVVSATGQGAAGIYGSTTTFLIDNTISNCAIGITQGIFLRNLTSGCASPFSGGTDAGLNL